MAKSNNLPTNMSSDLSSSQMYWIGIARHQIWKIWRIDEMCIGFEKLHSFMTQDKDNRDDEHILSDYFQVSAYFFTNAYFFTYLTALIFLHQVLKILYLLRKIKFYQQQN